MLDGVKHILITEHLDMTDSQTEPDLDEKVQGLDRAIGRVRETTRSIGVRSLLSRLKLAINPDSEFVGTPRLVNAQLALAGQCAPCAASSVTQPTAMDSFRTY